MSRISLKTKSAIYLPSLVSSPMVSFGLPFQIRSILRCDSTLRWERRRIFFIQTKHLFTQPPPPPLPSPPLASIQWDKEGQRDWYSTLPVQQEGGSIVNTEYRLGLADPFILRHLWLSAATMSNSDTYTEVNSISFYSYKKHNIEHLQKFSILLSVLVALSVHAKIKNVKIDLTIIFVILWSLFVEFAIQKYKYPHSGLNNHFGNETLDVYFFAARLPP